MLQKVYKYQPHRDWFEKETDQKIHLQKRVYKFLYYQENNFEYF